MVRHAPFGYRGGCRITTKNKDRPPMVSSPGVSITVRHDCGAQIEIPISWGDGERRNYFCGGCGADAVLEMEDIARIHEKREALREWLRGRSAALKDARQRGKRR
jgi:hypothetical protein